MASDGVPVETTPRRLSLQRRLSIEEDLHYRELMTLDRRPSRPPAYDAVAQPLSPKKGKEPEIVSREVHSEALPEYSCSIHEEGMFMRKMEIENCIKRAEDRNWQTVLVCLYGTALKVFRTKKDWGWGSSKDGPDVSPDNPPWVKKAGLDKSYSLLHADVGIAADYRKRRYVIRVRAEGDQFLLSCIELENFVKWLEALFAAIDVAAPIDEREFPRDQSIPRIQRLRWIRGERPDGSENSHRPSEVGEASSVAAQPIASHIPTNPELPAGTSAPLSAVAVPTTPTHHPPMRVEHVATRLSTTSYPNDAMNLETGKWTPRHAWTSAHDMLYAKLCYSVLLFKSPRKSNYIVAQGKQWFVDWATGRMFRVLPPGYGEVELFGPWGTIVTENKRI